MNDDAAAAATMESAVEAPAALPSADPVVDGRVEVPGTAAQVLVSHLIRPAKIA